MARQRDRVRHLTALLLKDAITEFEYALKDADSLTNYQIKGSFGFRGVLFVQNPRQKPPTWMEFVQQGVSEKIERLVNQSTAAVLFVERGNRRIAFTFGYGRNLLKPESFERDFGLKIALNTIDPESLRSVDVKNYEELSLHTRRQTSRGSKLETFGLNISQDLLRAVVGKPINQEFAHHIAGSDGVAFSVPLAFKNLGKKCDELLIEYESKKYCERYSFIDHLRAIRDPEVIQRLNEELVKRLRERNFENMHLAPPEPIDWQRAQTFTYSTDSSATPFYDLDVEAYRNTIRRDDELSVKSLKADWIGVIYSGSSTAAHEWSIYDSIVFEADYDGHLCVLSAGDWFEISKTFAEQTSKKVTAIKTSSIPLCHSTSKEKEEDYNIRAAKAGGFVLMDQKNIRCRDTNSDIEVCDLFTPLKQFVHVKRKTRSATLSHLFSQGVISAEAFLWDDDYRKAFRDHVSAANPKLAMVIPKERPNASQYEICFAVITKANRKWPLSLPFFSQLNLTNAADRLMRHGYTVSLRLIEAK